MEQLAVREKPTGGERGAVRNFSTIINPKKQVLRSAPDFGSRLKRLLCASSLERSDRNLAEKAARPVIAERLDIRQTTHRSRENLKAVWSEATDVKQRAPRGGELRAIGAERTQGEKGLKRFGAKRQRQ